MLDLPHPAWEVVDEHGMDMAGGRCCTETSRSAGSIAMHVHDRPVLRSRHVTSQMQAPPLSKARQHRLPAATVGRLGVPHVPSCPSGVLVCEGTGLDGMRCPQSGDWWLQLSRRPWWDRGGRGGDWLSALVVLTPNGLQAVTGVNVCRFW